MKNNQPSLYSRYFTPAERRALAALPFDDFSPEIKLFRVLLLRLLASQHKAGQALNLKDRLMSLRAISHATSSLGSLVRLHMETHSPLDELDKAIEEAVKEIEREMFIFYGREENDRQKCYTKERDRRFRFRIIEKETGKPRFRFHKDKTGKPRFNTSQEKTGSPAGQQKCPQTWLLL